MSGTRRKQIAVGNRHIDIDLIVGFLFVATAAATGQAALAILGRLI